MGENARVETRDLKHQRRFGFWATILEEDQKGYPQKGYP